MGSQQPSTAADAPQQELPPVWTRNAACPYFSRTTSLIFSASIGFSYLQIFTIRSGLTALLRVQHSAYRKLSSCSRASTLAVYQRKVPSRRTLTNSSFFSFSRWCESVELGISNSLPM